MRCVDADIILHFDKVVKCFLEIFLNLCKLSNKINNKSVQFNSGFSDKTIQENKSIVIYIVLCYTFDMNMQIIYALSKGPYIDEYKKCFRKG